MAMVRRSDTVTRGNRARAIEKMVRATAMSGVGENVHRGLPLFLPVFMIFIVHIVILLSLNNKVSAPNSQWRWRHK